MSQPSSPLGMAPGHHDRAGVPPWEIGRPQPVFVTLANSGAFRGRVLDVGCGTGEHALLAARLGLDVTGVDINDRAIGSAVRKAAEQGLAVRFQHLDARCLAELGDEQFDTVLDCELFHLLEGADRAAYVAGLHSVLRPGGRFVMLCYSTGQPDVPHRVSLDDILEAFADGWQVESVEPATIDTNVHPAGARGWLARLTRTGAEAAAVPAADEHHRDAKGKCMLGRAGIAVEARVPGNQEGGIRRETPLA